MIIYLSYYLGESSQGRYFDNFEDMISFINKYLDVKESNYNSFEMSICFDEEEDRIRKIIKEKQKAVEGK